MRLNPPPVELLAAPVLEGDRYLDRPLYFSDVIVADDHPARSFAELRGASWSFNDPDSHSGYLVVLYHLATMRENAGFFSHVVEAGSHQRSIRLVAGGEVDASAIDSQVLAVELREHPELRSKLRVVGSLGPSPIQPVVAAKRLPVGLKQELTAVLTDMHHDPVAREALHYGFVKRFDMVADADYDPIRSMLAVVERAGLYFHPEPNP
jgi:ABC-type phosphate/phosphonate transport system substrate-binding protein